ncbi:hypothetical protein [Streptomyces sp. CoH27]|uniref:hypothetical protein n=1 Tax=Streptomyces sp. CoH27 TaxID=2875763 RepID=UPI001CD2C1E7|nr:hypothetical protein [Streptomyces sp. CoH27]
MVTSRMPILRLSHCQPPPSCAGCAGLTAPTGRGFKGSVAGQVREGLGYVARTAALRAITCCTATANLFSGVLGAVNVLFLTRTLGLSEAAVGLLLKVLGTVGVLAAATPAGGSRGAAW